VAAAVGGALVVTPLGVVGWRVADRTGPAVQAVASSDPVVDYAALDLAAALEARERARASRARTTAAPSASPSASPTPAQPSASPSAAPTPAPSTPEPPPVPDVVGQLWVTADVNVRSGPSAQAERIGSLAAVTQVDVTGATENGWTQVVIDGQAGWVNSEYLVEAKPEPQPVAEAAPPAVSNASCPIGADIESNLTVNAKAVYRAVCAAFPGSVSSYGGYRQGDGGDHGSGRAVDIMVSGETGWEIARFVQARAAELGVAYVIYEQRIWMRGEPTGNWEWMEDRGSATANHYDHVHVSVS
jgi:uncharacterized protein YraI